MIVLGGFKKVETALSFVLSLSGTEGVLKKLDFAFSRPGAGGREEFSSDILLLLAFL